MVARLTSTAHNSMRGRSSPKSFRRRRIIRHYQDRPIDAEAIERIVANALRAPSGGFTQGLGFLVLTDSSGLQPSAAEEYVLRVALSSREDQGQLGGDVMIGFIAADQALQLGPLPLRWVYLHMLRETRPALRARGHPPRAAYERVARRHPRGPATCTDDRAGPLSFERRSGRHRFRIVALDLSVRT